MKKDEIIDDCRTTLLFWDCECKENFIQPRNVKTCHVCGAAQEDQPDSRINEVRDILKKDHLPGWSDIQIDKLLTTTTRLPRDFEELAKELKSSKEVEPTTKSEDTSMTEICMECGKSVAFGSGLYVDRIPDANTVEERVEMGVPFPEGKFHCIVCEQKYLEENGKPCQVCNNYELNVDSWEGFEAICQMCKSDMEDAIKNIQNEEWACWTLSTDDIIGIAKRKGISLIDKNVDDIARRVKNGIQWSLDEQWESIIEDAIHNAAVESKK